MSIASPRFNYEDEKQREAECREAMKDRFLDRVSSKDMYAIHQEAIKAGWGLPEVQMSKAAVTSMTRALAHEFAPLGIAVNAIQPGPTTTDMTDRGEEIKAFITGMVPAGRMADASEPAALVAYLAGPAAGFINGAAITIDGAMTA